MDVKVYFIIVNPLEEALKTSVRFRARPPKELKMLRIKIELVPYGNESLTREIGQMIIINDGTGDYHVGNYKYELSDKDVKIKGKLKGHNRLQSVFKLLQAVLNKAL